MGCTDTLKKTDKPVVAICYDFDKTLSPDNMQAQGYLQAINYENQDEFWKEAVDLACKNEMDTNLAWMYLMLRGSRGKSSGLKEMIEGTCIADKFTKIYASSFYYDEDGVAIWPAQVVNFTNKTQFLFRISKGVLDVNDDAVNDYFAPDEIRVPFTNMVYIGDSETDIPCMKLVHSYGGYSVGVYNPVTKDKSRVLKLMDENRIGYYAPADYTEGSELDSLVLEVLDKIGG